MLSLEAAPDNGARSGENASQTRRRPARAGKCVGGEASENAHAVSNGNGVRSEEGDVKTKRRNRRV